MKIEIRKAEAGDYNEIYSLIKEFATFIKLPDKVLISPEQMLQDKEYFCCFVAIDNNSIVGFATYFQAYYSWTGKAIYLDDLYVVQNYRGLGIGSKLFEKIIEIAKETKCYKVKWQVSKWNNKAIEFYKSKGALIDEVEINCELSI